MLRRERLTDLLCDVPSECIPDAVAALAALLDDPTWGRTCQPGTATSEQIAAEVASANGHRLAHYREQGAVSMAEHRARLRERRALTDDQVQEIRRAYRPRAVTAPMLAARYGVSEAIVRHVLGGHTYREE